MMISGSGATMDERQCTYCEYAGPLNHCVPMVSNQQKLGVIRLYFKQGHRQSEAEKAFLSTACSTPTAIVEHARAEEALRRSEERYALAARGTNDGLWDWHLNTNEIYLSPRWKAMLGFAEEGQSDTAGKWLRRTHPDDIEELNSVIQRHLEGLEDHFIHEYRVLHTDSTYGWLLSRALAVRDANGRPYRIVGSSTDTTDRKQAEQLLAHDAHHDGLTGLANRQAVSAEGRSGDRGYQSRCLSTSSASQALISD